MLSHATNRTESTVSPFGSWVSREAQLEELFGRCKGRARRSAETGSTSNIFHESDLRLDIFWIGICLNDLDVGPDLTHWFECNFQNSHNEAMSQIWIICWVVIYWRAGVGTFWWYKTLQDSDRNTFVKYNLLSASQQPQFSTINLLCRYLVFEVEVADCSKTFELDDSAPTTNYVSGRV